MFIDEYQSVLLSLIYNLLESLDMESLPDL